MDAIDASPRYRIEHRDGERSPRIVAFAQDMPFALLHAGLHRRRLRRDGERGLIAIVDQDTGAVVKAFPIHPA